MRIGTHVSIEGGLWNAPKNANRTGAEVFQIFSRNPHGGPVKPITEEIREKFDSEMKKYGFDTFYIHTPYFINLASEKNNIYYGSISVIRQELERGSQIGAKAIMTHLGSYGQSSQKEGLNRVVEAIVKILEGYTGSTKLYLEMSAGAGQIVGDSFEEIASIAYNKQIKKYDIGVCFDTCHAFASGYDISNKDGVKEIFVRFDQILGLEKLKLIHANDSKGGLGTHLDRHDNIGKGKIGLEGFGAMVNNKYLRSLDWILETPKNNPKDDPKNIAILRKLGNS